MDKREKRRYFAQHRRDDDFHEWIYRTEFPVSHFFRADLWRLLGGVAGFVTFIIVMQIAWALLTGGMPAVSDLLFGWF